MPVKSNCATYASPQLRVLTDAQCEEILLSAQEVLERTGVTVYDEEAREYMRKAGCWIDGIKVKIPSGVVRRVLQSVPNRVALCNSRTGSRDVLLEGSNAYFGTGSDTPYSMDPYSGDRVRSSRVTVGNACKVIDYLPNLDFVMSLGIVQDVPALVSDRWQFEAQVLNTSKPIVTTAHDIHGFADIIEMCEIIAGGEEELRRNPFMTLYAEPISPLQHAWEAASKLVLAAKKGLPVVYTPCMMSGGTGPATKAGILTQALAESLSGLVINQTAREGAPFIMGGVLTVLDMSSTLFSYGAPEFDLQMAGYADIAHFLGIPMFGTSGCTDAKVVDEQAGIESALSNALTALAGPNLNHDVGFIEYGSTSSLEYLVINDDVIGMARRFMRGFEIDEETLALDLIDKVGPGGDFLSEAHTAKTFARETFVPELFDAQRHDAWEADGSKTVFDRANEKVKDILENYEVDPLPKEVGDRVHAVVERAQEAIA